MIAPSIDPKTATLDEIRAEFARHSAVKWGQPGYEEASRMAKEISDAALDRFAEFAGQCRPEVADCRQCQRYALFFPGFHPPHKPSNSCPSGKRPHCTCDTCF